MPADSSHSLASVHGSIRRRAQRATEAKVIAAFTAIVDRQTAEGGLSPEVRTAIESATTRLESSEADPRESPLDPAAEDQLANDLRRLAMVSDGHRRTSPAVGGVIDAFHRLFFNDIETWRQSTWRGTTTGKCPLDLWLYQDILHALRPGLIVEAGAAHVGSTAYLADLCDLVGTGRVASVRDDEVTGDLPAHPRATYVRGSLTAPDTVAEVRGMAMPGEPVLVILGSGQHDRQVRSELKAYADLVTPGSYLIVEHTHLNGHPVSPNSGPGPMEAVDWFLSQRDDYAIDDRMHRYHLTFNPRGYLRRKD